MALTLIGIGSRAAGDDSVGVLLVEDLAADPPSPEVTCLVWEDADALTVAHDLLALTGPVLVVDCLDFAGPPGAYRVVEDAPSRLRLAGRSVSCHGFGMADALALAAALGFRERVDVFGVQPACLEPATGLSPALTAAMPSLHRALRNEIHRRLSQHAFSPMTAESSREPRP